MTKGIRHQQAEYIKNLRRWYPKYFKGSRVLEIGSLDVGRGNYRQFFDTDRYVGLDVCEGEGVDVVCPAHEYNGGDFDVVFSISSLEHDLHFRKTLAKMFECCSGLMFFSAANLYPAHGIRRSLGLHSGTSGLGDKWADYYKNITSEDVSGALDLGGFTAYEMSILGYYKAKQRVFRRDIRFWGRKKGVFRL